MRTLTRLCTLFALVALTLAGAPSAIAGPLSQVFRWHPSSREVVDLGVLRPDVCGRPQIGDE